MRPQAQLQHANAGHSQRIGTPGMPTMPSRPQQHQQMQHAVAPQQYQQQLLQQQNRGLDAFGVQQRLFQQSLTYGASVGASIDLTGSPPKVHRRTSGPSQAVMQHHPVQMPVQGLNQLRSPSGPIQHGTPALPPNPPRTPPASTQGKKRGSDAISTSPTLAQKRQRKATLAAQSAAYKQFQAEKKAAQQLQQDSQARADAAAEELRAGQAKKDEQQRKKDRKEELRKDPSAIYRHYTEYLEFFPLRDGEEKNQYLNMLLANRSAKYALPDTDFALAVGYAKENWEMYLVSSGVNIKWSAEQQRKVIERKKEKMAAGGEKKE